MGRLTTHVLDTVHGVPGDNINVELLKIYGRQKEQITTATTNMDGRCEQPLLENEKLTQGEYELIFHTGNYFRAKGIELEQPAFLEHIVIRFVINHPDQHYHVPLLVSPYGYSTYRGS